MISKQQQATIDILNDLHRDWEPHVGQLEVGRKIINGKLSTLFIQCGRKWGKSEFAIYMLWRHALLNPKSACYYVAPSMVHGRKLIWTDPRLATFCNVHKEGTNQHKYIDKLNSNEMIVRFKNGSFIQVLGSENYQAANGLRPGFLVYDEFCEFHPRFHETMNPNRMVYKCPLVIIGTPPMQDSINREQYITYADECKKKKNSFWIRQSSYRNPHIDPKELDQEKENLLARGEDYLWYSQYEAKLTAGGRNIIFPMIGDQHFHKHSSLMYEIKNDISKLEWFCVADPGTTTVMGLLFCAVNPYSKQIYILDEIYEKDPRETSVSLIIPRVKKIVEDLASPVDFDSEWIKVYDEAAAWFCNEVANQFGYFFMPTLKVHNKKEHGISLIKDILVHNVVKISDRCENLRREMENYVADEDGKFPRTNDHLIDCFRYFLAAAGYSMVEVMEAVRSLGPRVPGPDPHAVQSKKMGNDLDFMDWTSAYENLEWDGE